ncbi:MAG: alpha/beta hydrolase [Lachnospiraceae bacterium]|nr:alpha/beta hydrolase [Lachnospiraceae bacterium]
MDTKVNTEKIRINGKSNMEQVFTLAEDYSRLNKLTGKDSLHLRLIVEETLEMLRLFGDDRQCTFGIEGEKTSCIIRLTFEDGYKGSLNNENNPAATGGVTGKIKYLLGNSYEALGRAGEILDKIGVQKASEEVLCEAGMNDEKDAYVWTMESYNISSFDRLDKDGNEDWFEISRSIIANLTDDIRVFVMPEKTELILFASFGRKKEGAGNKYDIDPELEMLNKIPVAKTRFQIKLIQMMYGKLVRKQSSTDEYSITSHSFPCTSFPTERIPVLEYVPKGHFDELLPAVILYHGGAYLFPALPYHYRLAATVATRVKCRVFMVHYDLAPMSELPLQHVQAFEIYSYLIGNSARYHVDPDRIAVMGDSSGGTMSAAVCMMARDRGINKPAGQLLLYPSLDTRGNTRSMAEYTDVPVINSVAIRAFKKIIRVNKEEAGKYYISPVEAGSLSGLPPAYIETAEFDALHDEGVEYAGLLKKAGCKVILNETKGTVHSFDMAKDSGVFKNALDKRIEFLTSVLNVS